MEHLIVSRDLVKAVYQNAFLVERIIRQVLSPSKLGEQ